jgi:AcrR family transcriptional regulator
MPLPEPGPSRPGDRYHHGDLPNALKQAAAELITEKGPAGFSLREVARRAGVSHAAPAHHFGDSTGLLTALAVDAFQVLHGAMDQAGEGAMDPADRLVRIGRAYVEVGRDYPAHCAVVFRSDLVNTDDPLYLEWGERTYGDLVDAIEELRRAENPALDVATAAGLCWSAMQGLVVLFASMHKRALVFGEEAPDIDVLADRFARLLLDGLSRPGP